MSRRAVELRERTNRQIDEIETVFATLDDADLVRPSAGRSARTVGEEAAHIVEGYHFLIRFLQSAGHLRGGPAGGGIHRRPTVEDLGQLRVRLAESRASVARLGDLTDEQLASVPPPKSSRFSNGRRALDQIIEEVIAHQAGHLADLRRSIGAGEAAKC